MLLNSTSLNLHCVLFTFSNNCGTFCVRQVTEKRWEQNGEEYPPLIDFKNAYDSVRKEVLYNIITGFVGPMNFNSLIILCLKETNSKFRKSKHWSNTFPMKNGLEKEMLYRIVFSILPITRHEEVAATRRGFN